MWLSRISMFLTNDGENLMSDLKGGSFKYNSIKHFKKLMLLINVLVNYKWISH